MGNAAHPVVGKHSLFDIAGKQEFHSVCTGDRIVQPPTAPNVAATVMPLMAFLLPANLVNNMAVPPPLRQAAQVFRDWLPEQVTVTLYAPNVTRSDDDDSTSADSQGTTSRPYLVVLHPSLGIVFLDFVPGSTARNLATKRRPQRVLQRLAEETRSRLGQLSEEVRDRLVAQGLSEARLPVALAVAVPRLTRAKVLAAGKSGADQFLLQEDFSASSIESALERVLATSNGGRRRADVGLSAAEERRARAALNPRLLVNSAAQAEQGQLVFRHQRMAQTLCKCWTASRNALPNISETATGSSRA